MKKITVFSILVLLFSFVSCDTITHYTVRVSVDRNPTLTIVNQTGYPVVVTAPISSNIDNRASTQFQPTETNRSIDVTYRIEQIEFTEQVTMGNTDATVTLTRRPPTITVVNQTGYPVVVTAPVSSNINNGVSTQIFQPTETNRSIDVTYRIEQIEFTEQVTTNDTDITVTLTRRPPTITVVNQTGYQVQLFPPFSSNMNIGESTNFLPPVLNQIIDITYRIGQMGFTEQVNMRNQDVIVTLTRRPPTLTIVNNVGATINTIFLRTPGAPVWTGGNIVIRGGVVNLAAAGGAQAGDISGSIVNRDSMQIWMGNITLSGDIFDIRIDDVQGNTYVKSNVQIRSDMTLTFTASDRR